MEQVKFKAEYGDPVIVRIEHKGKRYRLRLNVQVLSITPTGTPDPNGNPGFNVQAAPVMTVEEDKSS